MQTFVVELVVKTEDGTPRKWDWSELADCPAEVRSCVEVTEEDE